MIRSLLLIGAGGFGREVAEAVRAINQAENTWDLLGFLDDGADVQGREIDGAPVLGPSNFVDRYPEAKVVVCTGNPRDYFSRKRIVARLKLSTDRFATLVHPSASIPPSAEIGSGTVLLAGVVLTTRARVGAHVAVMPMVVLTHDDVVSDYVTMGAGVCLAGRVSIGEGAYLGTGALVRERVTVGPWAQVGMGSVVLGNIPPGEVWAGVPARLLRTIAPPQEVVSRP